MYFAKSIPKVNEMPNLYLPLSTLGEIFSRRHTEIFFSDFFQKTGIDISCNLFPMEKIYMKCQIMFSRKNKKNITNLSSAVLAQRMAKAKPHV